MLTLSWVGDGLAFFFCFLFYFFWEKDNTDTNWFSTDVCYLELTIPVTFGMWLMDVGMWLRVLGAEVQHDVALVQLWVTRGGWGCGIWSGN